MFGFLNSSILIGLLAVTLPFLIHLLNRQKTRKVEFSSLRFLKMLQHKKMRRMKLRQWLLLILRALIIAMLVLAFARPTIKTRSFLLKGSNVRTTAVILLDNSMSMGTDTEQGQLFQLARKAALRVVQNLQDGDEIVLLSPTPEPALHLKKNFFSVSKVKDILKKEPLTAYPGKMGEAIREAVGILQKSINPNKELYIISDFQRSNFPKALKPLQTFPDIRTYIFFLKTTTQPNLGFTGVKLLDQIIEPGRPVKFQASVKNYGSENAPDRLVQVFLSGKRVAQSSLSLDAQATRPVIFGVTPETSRFQEGKVEIDDDPLLQDNVAYFTFFVPDKVNILLIGSPQETRFVRLALLPKKEQKTIFTITDVATWNPARISIDDKQVVILVDPPPFQAVQRDRLRRYLQNGGRLVFIPGAAMDLKLVNENFLTPLELPVFKETIGRPAQTHSFLSWGSIDFNHPIFQGMFREKKPVIDSPHFYLALKMDPTKKSKEIIQYRNGFPFLMDCPVGKGHVFLFTSGVNPEWSDWAFTPIFAPLMYRTVSYLSSMGNLQAVAHKVGEPIEFSVNESDQRIVIKKPDGTEVDVRPVFRGGSGLVTFRNTDEPGIYTLFEGREKKKTWAVNTDPVESNLEQLTPREVKKILGKNVWELSLNGNFSQKIKESRFGRELTPYFLYLAFILLVLEMILARTTPGKNDQTKEELP
ncbi:MAG: VWA domain-containing protein [Calditrichaeota bacterium]|nr:VWA domain-containing protein [Calditrichota bacterium]